MITSKCNCGREKDIRAKQCSFCARKSYTVNEPNLNEELKNIFIEKVKQCNSLFQLSKEIGFGRTTVSRWIKNLQLDISHFRPGRNRPQSLKQIFKKTLKRINGTLKKRILEENLLKYECSKCKNNGTWQDEKLVLELDHIDGDSYNNELNNLRFLCPNCHSQTSTNKGKNIRRNKNNEQHILYQ